MPILYVEDKGFMNNDRTVKLIIGGDYLPTEDDVNLFESEEIGKVFDKNILNLFENSDYSLTNLEGCFYDCDDDVIDKQGPSIRASLKSFSGYKKLGVKAANLANNHSRDYGDKGLLSTIHLLENNGIEHFGAGHNINEAKKPLIANVCGYRIGFLGISEYEFMIATESEAGANPFDELYTLDEIYNLKSKTDYVVVLYHGGKEYYRYPAPYVQKRCRRFIDKGADIVLCQHSHCIGCAEDYENGYILYGQGNFCFYKPYNEFTDSSLLVQIELNTRKIELIPLIRKDTLIRVANQQEKERILNDFNSRSEQIKDPEFVRSTYSQLSKEYEESYDWWCTRRIGQILKKKGLKTFYPRLFAPQKLYDVDMINMLRCEAHRDLYIQALTERNNLRK